MPGRHPNSAGQMCCGDASLRDGKERLRPNRAARVTRGLRLIPDYILLLTVRPNVRCPGLKLATDRQAGANRERERRRRREGLLRGLPAVGLHIMVPSRLRLAHPPEKPMCDFFLDLGPRVETRKPRQCNALGGIASRCLDKIL
jgi:hypothetical protein